MKYEDKDDTNSFQSRLNSHFVFLDPLFSYTFTYVFGACPLSQEYGLLFAVGKQLEDMIHMIESDLYETGWE